MGQGPAEIDLPEGVWILAADRGGVAASLAAQLAAQNQRVVLAGDGPEGAEAAAEGEAGIVAAPVEMERRESWQSLVEGLPPDVPFAGAVHLVAQDGHGADATTPDLAADAKRVSASALALVQGIADADAVPEKGLWFVTRGAQVLERERTGQLAGAALWGLGRVVVREAPRLQLRMLDLDPEAAEPQAVLADELLFPDSENHIAHRQGRRQATRLIRAEAGAARLALPEEADWVLAPDEGGAIETLRVQTLAARALEPKEVRVAVEACGLNFLDVFRAMGLVEEGLLGEEFCGRVVETGSDVTTVTVGDRVAGFAFGTFGPEVTTHEELVAPAPPDVSATALATIPSVFVTCVLSYQLAGAEGRGPRADSRRRGRRRPCGHPTRPGGRRGGVRHGKHAQASLPPLARRPACVRQPLDRFRPGNPGRDGRCRGRRRAEQPDRRGLYRGEPRLPRAGRPLRGARQAGHPERGRDGRAAAGCRLFDPRSLHPEAAGTRSGRARP